MVNPSGYDCKPDFGAPVRALRYYHKYMTEHPELRNCRSRLFIPFKDNNVEKELSAASISRWICTTIEDSHATIQNSKSIPGKVKAHEVCAVATLLQPFNKVDIPAVIKAPLGDGSVEAHSRPSTLETSVHKLTVYGRPDRS